MNKKVVGRGLAGALGIGFLITLCLWSKKPTLAVIDVQRIITKRAEILADSKISGTKYLQKAADQLKGDLHDFAKNQGIILLAKGTLVGGNLPDFTDSFLAFYSKERDVYASF